ncbi:hypothetical protein [Singulisphaera sp. PoT]|uniref:hypothetical protein n=1 Tax=Singulisphaera sp. PoT TaxID=3411797 RepID=UPI003BF52FC9
MAAANESQGLKIAVAAFVALTVILAVTAYFLYSNYDQASAQLAKAQDELGKSKRAQDTLLTQYEDLAKKIGARTQQAEEVTAEIKAAEKKITDEIASVAPIVNDMVGKVQAAGGASPTLDETKNTAANLIGSYQSEPNKNFIATALRLTELLKNQAKLSATVATSYVDLKRSLESVNVVNKQQLDVETKAKNTALADVSDEQNKHTEARADLLTKLEQYQADIANKATEIATLTTQIRQLKEDTSKKHGDLLNVIRELQDFKAQKEQVLDRPDGVITYVDAGRNEVRTNLTFSMGARPQMKMTIFDSASPGIPTEKPKGTIELTYVGDRYSLARITEVKSSINPFRVGDIVYSPAWSPNEPMRFALIGKMDVNRDGKDDRADLIRLIEAAGGIVDYDLPPPFAGRERGKISGRDAWYIIDERVPLRGYENQKEDATPENAEFLKKRSAAVREARDNGVRPMPIERLLNFLGYDFHAPTQGRMEAVDKEAMKTLGRPRNEAAKKAAAPQPATDENATPKEEAMPKDEDK